MTISATSVTNCPRCGKQVKVVNDTSSALTVEQHECQPSFVANASSSAPVPMNYGYNGYYCWSCGQWVLPGHLHTCPNAVTFTWSFPITEQRIREIFREELDTYMKQLLAQIKAELEIE